MNDLVTTNDLISNLVISEHYHELRILNTVAYSGFLQRANSILLLLLSFPFPFLHNPFPSFIFLLFSFIPSFHFPGSLGLSSMGITAGKFWKLSIPFGAYWRRNCGSPTSTVNNNGTSIVRSAWQVIPLQYKRGGFRYVQHVWPYCGAHKKDQTL